MKTSRIRATILLLLASGTILAASVSEEIRLTPSEIAVLASSGAGAGTSGVAGIRTTVLRGDPTKTGPYTIEIRVPAAARHVPSLAKKRVTPHTWRHSVGVQLVAAGVDVTVIRNWLGHARLDTTNHYARANLETKRKALEQVDPSTKPGKSPRWRRNPELLTWLDSL